MPSKTSGRTSQSRRISSFRIWNRRSTMPLPAQRFFVHSFMIAKTLRSGKTSGTVEVGVGEERLKRQRLADLDLPERPRVAPSRRRLLVRVGGGDLLPRAAARGEADQRQVDLGVLSAGRKRPGDQGQTSDQARRSHR